MSGNRKNPKGRRNGAPGVVVPAVVLALLGPGACARRGAASPVSRAPDPEPATTAPASAARPTGTEPTVRLGAADGRDLAATPAQPRMTGDDAAELLRQVADPQLAAPAREAAATRLVISADPAAIDAVRSVLLDPQPERGVVRAALVGAIARTTEPAPDLLAILIESLARASPDAAPSLIEAIGSFRTRDAAASLLARAGHDRPAAERAAAFRALARLSGRDEFGDRHDRWSRWFTSVRDLDEAGWQRSLASGLAARGDRLGAERRDTVNRLADASRRLYLALATPPNAADQSRFLGSLLADARDELRALGFDILSREVSSGRAVEPGVQAAVVRLLGDPSPAVRSRAALLLRQLDPPGAVEAVGRALHAEESPEAAVALLLAAARWPSEIVREPALRWLRNGPDSRAAAVQALTALARSRLLYDPTDREAVAAVLRAVAPPDLTPGECRLLVLVGNDSDRQRVASLLSAAPGPVRAAAAEALADDPDYLDRLIAAADAELYETVARAVTVHRPTAAGLRTLSRLPGGTPESRRAGVLRLASILPTRELIEAGALTRDLRLREAMLTRLADGFPPGDATPETLAAGLELLARTRLELADADGALVALDAISQDLGGATSESRSLRVVSLLILGRVDEAAEIDAPPAAWLDGLTQVVGRPHARAIADAIEARFLDRMAPDEVERYTLLRRRVGMPRVDANGPPL